MNQEIIDLLVESNNTLLSLFEVDGDNKREKEVNKIKRERKDKEGNETEVVSVADELFPYKGTAKEQFNQKVIAKINDMIEGTATLQDLIQLVRQGKSIKESLSENKPKDPKGYKENMDIANHYDNLYSKEPAMAPDGSPNSIAAEWNRRYQHYFDKAMKCYYGDKGKKAVKENLNTNISLLEEIISEVSDELKRRAQQKADSNVKLAELEKDMVKDAFNLGTKGVTKEDVNNAKLNVQKQVDRAAKLDNAIMKHTLAKMQGKIKPANENLEIMEEIISEVSDKYVGKRLEGGQKKEDIQQEEVDKILNDKNRTEEEKKEAAKKLAEYKCKNINITNKATD